MQELHEKNRPVVEADQDHVLGGGASRPLRSAAVSIGNIGQSSRNEKPGSQNQRVNRRHRPRNAVETREGEQDNGGHQLAGHDRLRQVQKIANRDIARYCAADAE